MKEQRRIGILLLIFGVAALAAWFGTMHSERAENNVPNEEQQDGMQDGEMEDDERDRAESNTFSGMLPGAINFSLDVPARAEVSEVQETIYEIKYVGPGSEPNTEITDGYYVSMQFVLDKSIPAHLDESAVVGELETTEFLGYDARRYERRSVLGNRLTEHLIIILDEEGGRFVDISMQTYDDQNGAYQKEIDDMLETLSFTVDQAAAETHPLIRVDSPERGTEVSSPITLRGEARGYWFFEATAPVVVVDWDGRILGEGYITADEEWMTEDFVPFSGELEFTQETEPYSASGTVIFQRSNPSDLPENDDAFEIPVILENN